MEQFLLNLLKSSLLGALAILLMLVSKPLWRERYRAKARCWLWLAVAGARGVSALPRRLFGEGRARAGRSPAGLHPLCRYG